jgi:hypothetical protein
MRPKRTFVKATHWHRGGNENCGSTNGETRKCEKKTENRDDVFGSIFRHQISIVVGTILA